MQMQALPLEQQLQALKTSYDEKLADFNKQLAFFQDQKQWVVEQLSHVDGLLRGQKKSPSPETPLTPTSQTRPEEASTTQVQSRSETQPVDINVLEVEDAFKEMTTRQAITTILMGIPGGVVDLQNIVRTLYGNLENQDLTIATQIVEQELKQGIEEKLWLSTSGGFAIEKTPELTRNKSTKGTRRTTKKESTGKGKAAKAEKAPKLPMTTMKPRFQEKTLFEAIEVVMSDNPGQSFDANVLAEEIYDKLPSEEKLAIVRKSIQSALSSGYLQGKWQRPNRGTYMFPVPVA